VRAGVVQVFALEVDLRAADLTRQTCCVVDRARAPNKVLEFMPELGQELGVVLVAGIGALQLLQRMDQGLGDKSAAVPRAHAC
jgi:hypothetical protein